MIQLQTLGAVDLRHDGVEVRSVLSQPKRLALLVYLATAAPRGFHSRDTLLGLFWPELDQERARNALRQALHYLRRSLGDDVVVRRGDREVGIGDGVLRCDAVMFDQAIDEGRHEGALALYRGDFLPGFYIEDAPEAERWLEEERARRRRAVVEAAWALARREEAEGELRAAGMWARRAASFEPHDEAVLRRLLSLLERAGEPAAALEAFAEFERRLEVDYELRPSAATVEQVERIRRQARGGGALVTDGSASVPEPEPAAHQPAPDAALPVVPEVASATAAAPSAPADPPPAAPAASTPARATAATPVSRGPRLSRQRMLAVAAAVAVVAFGGSWLALRGGGEAPAAAPADAQGIAVLPFRNLSGDPAREFFSDGLSEELLNVLAQIPDLRVAARTSSFRFRDDQVPVDSIGKLLRVDHVLEGSVREDGERVRITAQLIDARTGYHVWSRTYDRNLRDIFSVQDEISRAIVAALQVKLTGSQAGGPLVKQETADPEAHALVLKGSHMLRTIDQESLAQAAEFFEQAIQRDSSYARAYAGLSSTLQLQAYRRYIPEEEGYAEAKAAARRALELDPAQIRAHTVLARIAETVEWDFAAAEEHYRRAAELNPSTPGYLALRAFLLMRLGRVDEAIATAVRYTELEPDHAGGYSNLGGIYGYAHRFERALDAFHSALELDPENPSARLGLALTYSYLGRHDEALRVAELARRQGEGDQYVLSAVGFVLANAGRRAEAEEALRQLRAQEEASAYLEAAVLAGLGRRDEAFARLEEAVARREAAVPDLGVDPSFDSLRDDPRMAALLRRVGVREAGR
jgi:TolB-like protein/DNA-binding SARP family transcriptional activator/Flp pilus assembly protein TadD